MWNKIKKAWKSRTVWASTVLMALSAIQSSLIDLSPIMSTKAYGLTSFGIAMLILALRFDTNKGLHEK